MDGPAQQADNADGRADQTILRAAVAQLLDEFSAQVDSSGPALADLFADDATVLTPKGEVCGASTISAMFRGLSEQRRMMGRVSRHLTTALTVRNVGEGLIEARSLLVAFAIEAGESRTGAMLIGDQLDQIRGDANGRLRFVRREMTPSLEFDLTPKTQ